MVQSISGTITALFAACQSIYAGSLGTDDLPVLVSLGGPGKYQPHSVVVVGFDVRLPIARPTMGTNRSREQTAEIDVVISVWVPGDEDSQPIATASALTLMGLLETYLRTKPNEELGGACREAYVSTAAMVQQATFQEQDDPQAPPLPTGRVADLTVTVTASIRY